MKTIEQMIGSAVICGFHGTEPTDPEAVIVRDLLAAGNLGGVIFYAYNIVNPEQTRRLVAFLKEARSDAIISLDQEGGKVARLSEAKGFLPSISLNAISSLSNEEISAYYEEMAAQLADYGFNLNYAPVVDLADPVSPIIYGYERAASADPERVAEVAALIVDAHRKYGIRTCLKHFPGHGLATGDTHHDLVDITETWQPRIELLPYERLIAERKVDMVMTAHLIHQGYHTGLPASLIPDLNQAILRERFGYHGPIIGDDLCMGAISRHNSLKDTVRLSWLAGNDMIMLSNNSAAAEGNPNFQVDPYIAEKVIAYTIQLIAEGIISEPQIQESYRRVWGREESRPSPTL